MPRTHATPCLLLQRQAEFGGCRPSTLTSTVRPFESTPPNAAAIADQPRYPVEPVEGQFLVADRQRPSPARPDHRCVPRRAVQQQGRPTGRDLGFQLAVVDADARDERLARLRALLTAAEVDLGRVATGIDLVRSLPRTATRRVVVHGDLNPGNLLAAQRAPFLARSAHRAHSPCNDGVGGVVALGIALSHSRSATARPIISASSSVLPASRNWVPGTQGSSNIAHASRSSTSSRMAPSPSHQRRATLSAAASGCGHVTLSTAIEPLARRTGATQPHIPPS